MFTTITANIPQGVSGGGVTTAMSPMTRNLFRFKTERKTTALSSSFSLSPLGAASHGMLLMIVVCVSVGRFVIKSSESEAQDS